MKLFSKVIITGNGLNLNKLTSTPKGGGGPRGNFRCLKINKSLRNVKNCRENPYYIF